MTEVETTIEDKNLEEEENKFYTSYFGKRCEYLTIRYITILGESVDIRNTLLPKIKENFVLKDWLSGYIIDLYKAGMDDMISIYYYIEEKIRLCELPINETYFRSVLRKKFSYKGRFKRYLTKDRDYTIYFNLDRVKKDFIEALESGEYNKIKNLERDKYLRLPVISNSHEYYSLIYDE